MAIDSEREWADCDEEPVGGEGFAHLSGQSWSECHHSAQLVTEGGALGAAMRAFSERHELVRKGSRSCCSPPSIGCSCVGPHRLPDSRSLKGVRIYLKPMRASVCSKFISGCLERGFGWSAPPCSRSWAGFDTDRSQGDQIAGRKEVGACDAGGVDDGAVG